MDTNENRTEALRNTIERDILLCCGINIRNKLLNILKKKAESISEIRLRVNKPLMISQWNEDSVINAEGETTNELSKAYLVTPQDILQTIELMSENSLYAFQEEVKNGFLTIKGGHRIGIAGKVVMDGNQIKTIKDISGLNIRIARQIKGCASGLIPYILDNGRVSHTLIVSPPNCGKTTMLRDLIRQISDGVPSLKYKGVKVGLVDERSELASCYRGIPQNDVGMRTDVLDGCTKPNGILMLLRSMSPNVIATDELGTTDDITTVEQALNAGIKILTTAHAGSLQELSQKTGIGELFKRGLFERLIVLNNSRGPGTIEDIIDGCSSKSIWGCKNAS